MSLKLVFRIAAVISAINGLGLLFMTSKFFEMANLTLYGSDSLITVGEFLGVTILFLALVTWRIPDVAGGAITSLGQLWSYGYSMWVLIIGYHIITEAASGVTAYGNIVVIAILAVLFFMRSKKSE